MSRKVKILIEAVAKFVIDGGAVYPIVVPADTFEELYWFALASRDYDVIFSEYMNGRGYFIFNKAAYKEWQWMNGFRK